MKPSDARACCTRNYTDLIEKLVASSDPDSMVVERLRKHRSALESCGKPLALPNGDVTFWCRRPVCPRCSAYWSRELASHLMCWCPDADHADLRTVVLTLSGFATAADAFISFQAARRHLGQRLYDLRETSLYKAQWSRFAAVGALVIDYVGNGGRGSAWIARVHVVVHVGDLGNDDVRAFFELSGPIADVQPMDASETTQQTVQNIIGNATTVHFASGHWPDEAIQEYLLACAQHASGRKGLKMAMKPRHFRGRRPSFQDGFGTWAEQGR
jgi:hypothetical protein